MKGIGAHTFDRGWVTPTREGQNTATGEPFRSAARSSAAMAPPPPGHGPMGYDETQIRQILHALVESLVEPYRKT